MPPGRPKGSRNKKTELEEKLAILRKESQLRIAALEKQLADLEKKPTVSQLGGEIPNVVYDENPLQDEKKVVPHADFVIINEVPDRELVNKKIALEYRYTNENMLTLEEKGIIVNSYLSTHIKSIDDIKDLVRKVYS